MFTQKKNQYSFDAISCNRNLVYLRVHSPTKNTCILFCFLARFKLNVPSSQYLFKAMSSPSSRLAFDSHRFGSGRIGDEVGRRQEEWEREIETLDQKEMELHQSQLRLIREQTAIFIRDLGLLQGEVSALKENVGIGLSSNIMPLQNDVKEQKAKLLSQEQIITTTQKRVEYLERLLGESVERHSQEIESAKSAHVRLADEAKAREAHHASVAERLNYIEQLVGDSFERHSKEIQASHTRLETMHSRLVACESDANHKSLRERVDFLEKLLGESVDKHSEGLQAAHSNLQKLHGSLQEQMSTRMEKLHGNVQERLQAIEKQLGQVDDRREAHARELQQVKSQVDQAHQKLGNPTKPQSSLHHATMAERMEYLEKLMGDSADKHSSELGQAHTKLDQLRGRLTDLEAARDRHHAHIQELAGREKEARDKQHEHHKELLGRERAANEAHHASVAERLKYIEQLVGDSCERHSKEIQASHTRLETMHGRLVACESDASHKSLRERVDFLEKLLGESADKHSEGLQAAHSNLQKLHGSLQEQMSTRMDKLHGNVQERLQAIEKQLGQVDDRREAHARELQQVKSQVDQAHQKLGNPTKPQSSLHHATMAERMEYLEKLMGDSADKHSSELGQAHTKLDQLRGRLTTLEAARDQHHAHIQELVGREKEARDKQHEHHQELLGRERAANEGRHRDIHEVIQKERKAREQHHGMLHDLVHKEKAARGAIEELLAQEKAERSKHHSSFEERIESVQKTLGIFDSLLRKEIEERTKEYRRLWDAIDTHTHDLSTQVIGEASGYTPEMADPPRRYPLASAPVQQGWTSGVQPIVYQEPVVTSLPPTPGIRQLSPMVQVQPASSWGVQAK
ncbi:unnamed protein product [Durusdinium trenchii]|uniref:Uncharacterized protein n=1 Tax=Durusdinium trenchii TaxID=1381693 RepID=A0ABP0SME1_9DINO